MLVFYMVLQATTCDGSSKLRSVLSTFYDIMRFPSIMDSLLLPLLLLLLLRGPFPIRRAYPTPLSFSTWYFSFAFISYLIYKQSFILIDFPLIRFNQFHVPPLMKRTITLTHAYVECLHTLTFLQRIEDQQKFANPIKGFSVNKPLRECMEQKEK